MQEEELYLEYRLKLELTGSQDKDDYTKGKEVGVC